MRTLAKNRGFAVAAVVTLSLGIGINTAFVSLADAVLFRPFPISSPEGLVALFTAARTDSKLEKTSYPDYLEYKSLTDCFAGVAAYARMPVDVKFGQWAERIEGEVVSGDYFDVLGMKMAQGRGFVSEEDREPGSRLAAVVSYGFWQRNLGSDPSAAGSQMLLNGHPVTVVGVAPKGFRGMTLDREPPEIWLPMATQGMSRSIGQARELRLLELIGRLKSGVTLDQARSAARVRAGMLENAFPRSNGGRTVTVLPKSEARFWPTRRNSVISILALLLASSGIVLVISCVNMANLLLVHASSRHQEIAIRTALGAGRTRLARQFLTEVFLLSAVGLGFSLLVTEWVFGLIVKYPQLLSTPMTLNLSVDLRVFGIAAALSILTAAASALFPILGLRTDVTRALQYRGHSMGYALSGSRLRSALAAVQVAFSLVLLTGAGLFVRTVQKAESLDTGYRDENVLVLTIGFTGGAAYDDGKALQVSRQLLERIRNLPGVRSATFSGDLPLTTRQLQLWFVKGNGGVVRDQDWIQVNANIVGPRYFETLRIPIFSGRDFTDSDDESAGAGAIIISRSMADRYWPGVDPVGKSVKIRARIPGSRESYRIVGVSKDLRQRSIWEEMGPYAYLPLYQRFFQELMLMVRTEGNPMSLLPAIVGEIHSLDANLPVYSPGLLSEQVDKALSTQRMAAAFLSTSGFFALVLAALGIYGVVSYVVIRRRHEIGIRMALGADRVSILWMLLRNGMTAVGIGIAFGLPAAFALSRTVASFLYGVSPSDPATFAFIALVLASVSLIACYIPARRACSLEPLFNLHRE